MGITTEASREGPPCGGPRLSEAVGGLLARLRERLDLHSRYRRARARLLGLRRERELETLAGTLEGLSDRQLAALGLERDFLYTELEARFEGLAEAAEDDAAETDGAARGPRPQAA